jgi:hypothetical protein
LAETSAIDTEVEKLRALCVAKAGNDRLHRLEALWDGDTVGWFLELFLTVKSAAGSESRALVATLRYGSDIRLFNHQVPPWPEAIVAKELGERLQRDSGCSFWFPSPDDPDNDNPSFEQRHDATTCPDCGKLFLADAHSHVPQDVCYHCHLARERSGRS